MVNDASVVTLVMYVCMTKHTESGRHDYDTSNSMGGKTEAVFYLYCRSSTETYTSIDPNIFFCFLHLLINQHHHVVPVEWELFLGGHVLVTCWGFSMLHKPTPLCELRSVSLCLPLWLTIKQGGDKASTKLHPAATKHRQLDIIGDFILSHEGCSSTVIFRELKLHLEIVEKSEGTVRQIKGCLLVVLLWVLLNLQKNALIYRTNTGIPTGWVDLCLLFPPKRLQVEFQVSQRGHSRVKADPSQEAHRPFSWSQPTSDLAQPPILKE